MLVHQRRQLILEAVRRRGSVAVTTLAEELNVSGMTIRRDLEALAGEKKIRKVHGGATLPSDGIPAGLNLGGSVDENLKEKDSIGALASQMVAPGMSVGISGGSTTWSFARHLATKTNLTIVTNSLRVADECHRHRIDATVILTGGIRSTTGTLIGPVADQTLHMLHCDIVFLGAHGIDTRAGLTCPNLAEAQTSRALVECGARLVTLVDHTKFGKVGLTTIVPLTRVNTLVTDEATPSEVINTFSDHIGDIRISSLN